MLEVAGLPADEERVYRFLVAALEADAQEVVDRLRLDHDHVVRLLRSLLGKGLVSRVTGSDPRYRPTPPDVAFGPLLQRGQRELELARSMVSELEEEYRSSIRRRNAGELVEVVTGGPALRQHLRTLQRGAREELMWFCRAEYVVMPSSDNTEEFEMLARGVRYRVVYERALLEEPGMVQNIAEGMRRGEQARVVSSLPVRLAVADRSIGLCPLVPGGPSGGLEAQTTTALVRPSSLLDALVALFESYWERAAPLTLARAGDADVLVTGADTPGTRLDIDERYLLSLLLAGVSDKAIATQLQVSMRTVQRRIRDLMRQAGAETRMQLAWQVARRGWMGDLPGGQDWPEPPQV